MNDFELFCLLVLASAVAALMLWQFQYWKPKVSAYKTGSNRVPIWFGCGEFILWNPGQTFAFLCNKQLVKVGDPEGGVKTIFAFRGEEAVGPIQMQTALFNWEDQSVLTRDGQTLSIKIGAWWRVKDAAKYVFQIYADSKNGSGVKSGLTGPASSQNAAFNTDQVHKVADHWLCVITESTIRAKVSTLTVAEVVSSQAKEFLHFAPDQDISQIPSTAQAFETAIGSVLGEVQKKAEDFGVEVTRIEVQHVYLPKEIQDAINQTRIAFLAPIRSEREAEAKRIALEKLVSVLGKDAVGLNEIMKNLQNANFITPMNFLQPLLDGVTKKSESLSTTEIKPKQLTDNSRRCTACGASVQLNERFCGSCGEPVA